MRLGGCVVGVGVRLVVQLECKWSECDSGVGVGACRSVGVFGCI